MNSNRRTAIIVGVLFITATVASSLCIAILSPILDAPDYLLDVSANEHQVIVAALLMLIDAVAVVGIAIAMYRVLKEHSEAIALGYVAARIVESVLFIVYVIVVLLLVTLSLEFVGTGAPDVSYFQTGGTLFVSASDWTLSLGLIIFALSALIFNYSLLKSKLVPRWLSGWGLVGAILIFAVHMSEFFSIELTELLDWPIAVQEMVFAVWLIVKGFSPSTPERSQSSIQA